MIRATTFEQFATDKNTNLENTYSASKALPAKLPVAQQVGALRGTFSDRLYTIVDQMRLKFNLNLRGQVHCNTAVFNNRSGRNVREIKVGNECGRYWINFRIDGNVTAQDNNFTLLGKMNDIRETARLVLEQIRLANKEKQIKKESEFPNSALEQKIADTRKELREAREYAAKIPHLQAELITLEKELIELKSVNIQITPSTFNIALKSARDLVNKYGYGRIVMRMDSGEILTTLDQISGCGTNLEGKQRIFLTNGKRVSKITVTLK